MREVSKSTKLFQAGFVDAARAETLLADNVFSAFDEEWLIARFAKVADPDLGLLHFLRLLEAVQNSGEDVARQLEKLL
ncbi:MAG: hypothetical protein SPG61_03565, partial [Arcanobacterium sp.]|nr:hypothetical protein [Arcanobacterium sp.]